jgi:hypothetical protein
MESPSNEQKSVLTDSARTAWASSVEQAQRFQPLRQPPVHVGLEWFYRNAVEKQGQTAFNSECSPT